MKNRLTLLTIIIISFLAFPKEKPRMMWFDAEANWQRFCHKDSIVYYLDKVKKLGFTDVVIDIKPITGEVLYKSKIAPQMTEWNKVKRDASFNYLQFFIDEGHKRKLKVHASANTFVAGHNFFDRGVMYSDKNKSSWQSVNYTDSGMVKISLLKHKYSTMLNPALKEVQDYEISIFKELAGMYPKLDGIILDRVRYDCIEADFSSASKKLFEIYIGRTVNKFPDDIYKWGKDSTGAKIRIDGPLFKQWLEWRASVIYNFIRNAKAEIKKVNKHITFGDYTGAWYPTYYEVGVNWASRKYDPSSEYDWATRNYKNYGYAELLDVYTTGNYFFEVTKDELISSDKGNTQRTEAGMHKGKEYWYSVEGSAELVNKVLNKAVPVYAGLYVDQYKGNKEQFVKALKMCLKKSDGLMVFDIVHIINNNWWDALEQITPGKK